MISSRSVAYGKKLRSDLSNVLGVNYQQRIIDGLSGDSDAAYTLAMSAGRYAACLPSIAYYTNVPEPGYTRIVETVWIYSSENLIEFLGKQHRMLIRKFMRKTSVNFSGLPTGQLNIYRGVTGINLGRASRGLAWSYSYDAACWFAFRLNHPDPLVVRASVNQTDIIFHCVKQGEHEVILNSAPKAYIVDDVDEWKRRADIRKAEIDRNRKNNRIGMAIST